MASIVQGTDVLQAWCNGAQLLSQTPDHAICNLITEVEDPILYDPEWYRRFDPKSVGADDRLSVVAKVLFPGLPRRQATFLVREDPHITLYPSFSPWWIVFVAIAGAIPVLWRIPQLFRELDDLEIALVALQRDNWPTETLGA